jgi:hypothetical protein
MDEVLLKFFQADHPMTATEAGITRTQINKLRAEGLLVERGRQITGRSGRKPILWALSGKARKRAQRVAAKNPTPRR